VVKILSRSGSSLADVYDVVGSVAGINELVSQEVSLVHEMGSTLFSERFGGRIVRVTTGGEAQNTSFNTQFDVGNDVPGVSRILGAQIICTSSSRLTRVQLSITSPEQINDQDLPIFAWQAGQASVGAEVLNNGTVATYDLLTSVIPVQTPNVVLGGDSESPINLLTLRGITAGFGSGTVTTTGIVYMGFSQPGGLSNRGLPLPSW
jgi:hypothetical protein